MTEYAYSKKLVCISDDTSMSTIRSVKSSSTGGGGVRRAMRASGLLVERDGDLAMGVWHRVPTGAAGVILPARSPGLRIRRVSEHHHPMVLQISTVLEPVGPPQHSSSRMRRWT